MKADKAAIRANQSVHDAMADGEYASLAPHLCHSSIRALYRDVVGFAYVVASRASRPLRVLDLGAGDGSATISFLERGCHVLAVDISSRQLDQLRDRCRQFDGLLETRKADMSEVLKEEGKFDVIVMNSVLHHIPDYMAVLELVARSLSDDGVFMSFQDPKWKSSISFRDALLSNVAYVCWRLGRGDVVAGIWRRMRRMVGIYNADSEHDNSEYHAVRDGVNQNAICDLFSNRGMRCELIEYCSFHSSVLQPLGETLSVHNTFAIVAGKGLSRFENRDYEGGP